MSILFTALSGTTMLLACVISDSTHRQTFSLPCTFEVFIQQTNHTVDNKTTTTAQETWCQPCHGAHNRVRCRNGTCRSAEFVRQFCVTRIFCTARRTPAHVRPRSCRRRVVQCQQQHQQHLSMHVARVTAGGMDPRRRRATTQCDHAETLALNTVPHDMRMHSSRHELRHVWSKPLLVLSISTRHPKIRGLHERYCLCVSMNKKTPKVVDGKTTKIWIKVFGWKTIGLAQTD